MKDASYAFARGSHEAYARYLQGMDASMRQKVALTAALLLAEGRVADMGMGSGAGSEALAALYPSLNVVGIDLDPTMVELAREKYVRPNLSFVVGDVASPPLEAESCSGIFNSSVLHHVTSFGGYRYDNAKDALAKQVDALRLHGVLIVRDFLAPEASEELCELDLSTADGDDSDDPRSCSTAALFRKFAREFRAVSSHPGFTLDEGVSPHVAHARFCVSERLAVEFLLRKDYRADWVSEVKEEYAYYTQIEFEEVMRGLGLRMLHSSPLRNPWIVQNRLRGKYHLSRAGQALLDPPATNYLIAAEKVSAGEGVRFEIAESPTAGSFLRMAHYVHSATGSVRDLVQRPHATLDVLPYFEAEETLYVLARMSYPRPLAASVRDRNLDGSTPAHYVTEPLNVLQTDAPLGLTVEEMLETHARIPRDAIQSMVDGATYYPSPGGIQEEVRSVLVEVTPRLVEADLPKPSGLSTGGRVRAMDAHQVLRAAQVGGLPDARLELNTYELLLQRGASLGPWIGEQIVLRRECVLPVRLQNTFAAPPPRRMFSRAERAAGFLALHACEVVEHNGAGELVGQTTLECVKPSQRSTTTVACALLASIGGEVYIGIEDDDLPAAQAFRGSSSLWVCPAWRLPPGTTSMAAAYGFVQERLRREYGVDAHARWDLGGAYYPSLGLSPEVVFPMAIEVQPCDVPGNRTLTWVGVRDLVRQRSLIQDGHLRIALLRAAHACGVLG